MRTAITLVFFLAQLIRANAQDCPCPNEHGLMVPKNAAKVFSFSNKARLGLCGYIEIAGSDTNYSEFSLVKCGESKMLKEWDATQNCKVRMQDDTLIVEELYGLAIGKKFEIVWEPFYINKFYPKGNNIQERTFFRKDIPKYTKTQIDTVLAAYKDLEKPRSSYDSVLQVAHMLFWAYVSGCKEAEIYLRSFPREFGPFDGGISEEWSDLIATFEHWKEKNGGK